MAKYYVANYFKPNNGEIKTDGTVVTNPSLTSYNSNLFNPAVGSVTTGSVSATNALVNGNFVKGLPIGPEVILLYRLVVGCLQILAVVHRHILGLHRH